MNAPEWGPNCVRCGCPKLVHRGVAHDQSCAAVKCALDLDRRHGWAARSRCTGYVAPGGAFPLPDESNGTSDRPTASTPVVGRPSATVADVPAPITSEEAELMPADEPLPPDDDQPYERIREETGGEE